MSMEEISSLYNAIKQPDDFRSVFEALGISETKFQIKKEDTTGLQKEEREAIMRGLIEIILDLDKTPELPEIAPKTNLEALISPRPYMKNGNKHNEFETRESLIDPRKLPGFNKLIQNEVKTSFEKFLNRLSEINDENIGLKKTKPLVTQSLPKLQSINKAFRPYYFSPVRVEEQPVTKSPEIEAFKHERALK